MTVIRQQDVTQSIADALQYISYYHPVDFIQAVKNAYDREESKSAKDAKAQILINSRLCATGKRPICQDTGIVTIFVKVGMQVQWDAEDSAPAIGSERSFLDYSGGDPRRPTSGAGVARREGKALL